MVIFGSPKTVTHSAKLRLVVTMRDILGGLGPPEGLRLLVVLRQIVVDRGLQVIDAGIAATSDAPRCDFGKKAFDKVQP